MRRLELGIHFSIPMKEHCKFIKRRWLGGRLWLDLSFYNRSWHHFVKDTGTERTPEKFRAWASTRRVSMGFVFRRI